MKRVIIIRCKNCRKERRIHETEENEFKQPVTLECSKCHSVYRDIMVNELFVKDVTKLEGKPDEFMDIEVTSFFAVSKRKLIIMGLCTFGIYELYWFYKNWQLVKMQTGRDIRPFWRAVFSIFFCHSLFKTIERTADEEGIPYKHKAGILTGCYIFLALSYNIPDPLSIISFVSFIPLLAVQRVVNDIHARTAPDTDPNNTFSKKNIAAIIIGGLVLIFALIGAFIPE